MRAEIYYFDLCSGNTCVYWHVSGQVVVGIEYFPTLRTRECFLLGLGRVLDPRGWSRLVRGQGLREAERGERGSDPPQLGSIGEAGEHGGEPEAGGAGSAGASSEEAGSGVGAGAGGGDQGGEEGGAPGITARPSNYTPLVVTSHRESWC